jgi:hypothetical protein
VAALMPLARCLSGHTKLRGNFRPADPEADCRIDERVKLRLGPVPLDSNALDSLQDLCQGALGRLLLGARGLHRVVMCLVGSCRLPRSLSRPPPWLRHAIKDASHPAAVCCVHQRQPDTKHGHLHLSRKGRTADGGVVEAVPKVPGSKAQGAGNVEHAIAACE